MSVFALILATRSLQLDTLEGAFTRLPRRFLASFLFASGAVTVIVWVGPLLAALIGNEPPELLNHSTTMVTEALDLAIITPLTVISGLFVLHRQFARGIEVAVPLLGLLVVLLPAIVLQTIFQLEAGVEFAMAEIIGPIIGFLILGAIALYLLGRVLACVKEDVT